LLNFTGRVGSDLVAGEYVLVDQFHESGITDPRILDRLSKGQDVGITMRLVNCWNAIELPRIGDACLVPSFASGCDSAELGEDTSDFLIAISHRHVPDQVNVFFRGLILDSSRHGFCHRKRGMAASVPMNHESQCLSVIIEIYDDLLNQDSYHLLFEIN